MNYRLLRMRDKGFRRYWPAKRIKRWVWGMVE